MADPGNVTVECTLTSIALLDGLTSRAMSSSSNAVDCNLSSVVLLDGLTSRARAISSNAVECTLNRSVNCGLSVYFEIKADPYNTKHTYSIQEMINLHKIESLEMDNLLAILTITSALSKFYGEQGYLSDEQNHKKYITDMVNIYNQNEQAIQISNLSTVYRRT